MATPEQRLNQWIKSALPKTWQLTRIETTTGRGIPDLHIASPWGGFWIESKADRGTPWLRPEQYAWMFAHNRAGGLALVLHKKEYGPATIWSLNLSKSWVANSSGFMVPAEGVWPRTIHHIRETLTNALTYEIRQHAIRSANHHP
jgi:hypothetical protein